MTDLGKIIDNIDEACGRNDALRAYIYALRDLQWANNQFAYDGEDDSAIDRPQAAVREAFDRLIVAEFLLNRDLDSKS